MSEELKTVKEVFPDFETEDKLLICKIKKANLYKKENKLALLLVSEEKQGLKSIYLFENYLKNRFKVKDVRIKLEGSFDVDINKEWNSVVKYINIKYPITRAILVNSNIEINNKIIIVNLAVVGKDFMTSSSFDNIINRAISDFYLQDYKIKFEEKIDEELVKKYEGNIKRIERMAIEIAEQEIVVEESPANAPQDEQEMKKELTKSKNDNEIKDDTKNEEVKTEIPEEETPLILGRSLNIRETLVKVEDLGIDSGKISLEGEIVNIMDARELKSGKFLVMFDLYDGTSTITCKAFVTAEKIKQVEKRIKNAKGIKLEGTAQFDPFAKELGVIANIIIETPGKKKEVRMDNAAEKRVELHMHTQMSQMDGITSATDLIKRAMSWGMKSIAITDHGVVQAFPEAHKLLGRDNKDIKVIYGVEAYLVPDKTPSVSYPKGQDIDTTYCVLDLETTGFSFRTEKITEVGIMKYKNGEVIDSFETFVNPEKPIPERVVEVTHITDDMVKDAPKIEEVFPKILEFVGDSVLVAHNADFDIGFLKHNASVLGYTLDNTYLDTLRLAKELFPDFKKYKLGLIAEKLGIKVEVAHRALDDVDTTVKVFRIMLDMLKEKKAKTVNDIDKVAVDENYVKDAYKKLPSYHAIILAKDYVGLKNLYKLVSISHLQYFYKKPRILKSLYKKYSEGLILGSACEQGELYRAIVAGKDEEEIENIARDYDYLEIQPIGNNEFMVRTGVVPDREALKDINKKIVALGEKLHKLVVATCDVHFMDPQDEIYRRVLQAGQGYDDADQQAPLYLRTTNEMLQEFEYLGMDKAFEVVVTNTNKVADMCQRICPISPEKCPPHIPGCEETIKEIAYGKAHELYAEELPKIVEDRLEKELNSIIKNGFSVMYIIAQKLVWKSNEDGYIVGSRGSVGSSFVANMTGITEVNSLPPHYRCPNCKYSDFTDYGYKNGFDLPDKECPKCRTQAR